MEESVDSIPICQPRWLIVFNLLLECESIFNRFQSQPQTNGVTTVTALPLMEEEATWSPNIEIPPFFNYHEHTPEISYVILYDMVKYIFNRYMICVNTTEIQ